MLRLLLSALLLAAAAPAGAESLAVLSAWSRFITFTRAHPEYELLVDAQGRVHHGEPLAMESVESVVLFFDKMPEGAAGRRYAAEALWKYVGCQGVRDEAFEKSLFESDTEAGLRLTAFGRRMLVDSLTARDGALLRQTLQFRSRLKGYWKPESAAVPRGPSSVDFDGSGGQDDGRDALFLSALRGAGMDGAGAVIGFMDTGVDRDHPDLAGRVPTYMDFTGSGPRDRVGHGTHVTGIAHSVAPNADLAAFKVTDGRGDDAGFDDRLLAAMQAAASLPKGKRPDVMNISIGGPTPSVVYDHVNQYANELTVQGNILVVVAAGNHGEQFLLDSPGNAEYALSVTGTDKTGGFPEYTGRGPAIEETTGFQFIKPDLATLAGSQKHPVYSAGTGTKGRLGMNGTSQAAPFASGAAAAVIGWLKEHAVAYRATEVKAALMEAARDTGWSREIQGAGQLDGRRLAQLVIERAKAGVPVGNIACMLAMRVTDDQRRGIDASGRYRTTPLGIVDYKAGRLLNTDKALRVLAKNAPPIRPPKLPGNLLQTR